MIISTNQFVMRRCLHFEFYHQLCHHHQRRQVQKYDFMCESVFYFLYEFLQNSFKSQMGRFGGG